MYIRLPFFFFIDCNYNFYNCSCIGIFTFAIHLVYFFRMSRDNTVVFFICRFIAVIMHYRADPIERAAHYKTGDLLGTFSQSVLGRKLLNY